MTVKFEGQDRRETTMKKSFTWAAVLAFRRSSRFMFIQRNDTCDC